MVKENKDKKLKYNARMAWVIFSDETFEAKTSEEAMVTAFKRFLVTEENIKLYTKKSGLESERLWRGGDNKAMRPRVGESREICPECDCSCQKKKECLVCNGLGFMYQEGSFEKLEHAKLIVEWDKNSADAKARDKLKRDKKQFLSRELEMLSFSGQGNSSKDHMYKCSGCNGLYRDSKNPFTHSGGGRFIDGKFICYHCKEWSGVRGSVV